MGGEIVDYDATGQRIRRIRKVQGISQEILAEKTGISTTHMSDIKTADTKLSLLDMNQAGPYNSIRCRQDQRRGLGQSKQEQKERRKPAGPVSTGFCTPRNTCLTAE